MLRQLLLIPLLMPLLAVLLVGAINPRPAIQLRLLIWSSPALPVGVWMMLAAGGGGLLSALGAGLALRGPAPSLVRQVRRPVEPGWEQPQERSWASWNAKAASAGPSRAAGEPSPTVEVPYRVIRRGSPAAPAPTAGETTSRATASATAAGDGWDQPLSDDW